MVEGTPEEKHYNYATLERMRKNFAELEREKKEVLNKAGKVSGTIEIKGGKMHRDNAIGLIKTLGKRNTPKKILATDFVRSNNNKEPFRKSQSSGPQPS